MLASAAQGIPGQTVRGHWPLLRNRRYAAVRRSAELD